MKKEMKKNNKMILALVVIAALSMVSVAAVVSDDSDAAVTATPLDPAENFVVKESGTQDYDFYIESVTGGAAFITVPDNVTYSGKIRLGTWDGTTYTSFSEIELTNASAVKLTVVALTTDAGLVTYFMLGNSAADAEKMPGGTYELKQGQVMLGSVDADALAMAGESILVSLYTAASAADMGTIVGYLSFVDERACFNGTLKAGDFSLTAEYVFGALVSIESDGKARLSGVASSPQEGKVQDDQGEWPQGTLSLSGPVSIQYPSILQKLLGLNGIVDDALLVDDVEVTVEDGAVVTAGDKVASFASTVTITAGSSVTESYLLDLATGLAWMGSTGGSDTVFNDVPTGKYKAIVVTGGGLFFGDVQVASSGAVTITGALTSSATTTLADVDLVAGVDPGTLVFAQAPSIYTVNNQSVVYQIDTANWTVEQGIFNAQTEVITFPSGDNSGLIFGSVRHRADGNQQIFLGSAGANTAPTTLLTVATGANPVPTATQIAGGSTAAVMAFPKVYYVALDESLITVKGNMDSSRAT